MNITEYQFKTLRDRFVPLNQSILEVKETQRMLNLVESIKTNERAELIDSRILDMLESIIGTTQAYTEYIERREKRIVKYYVMSLCLNIRGITPEPIKLTKIGNLKKAIQIDTTHNPILTEYYTYEAVEMNESLTTYIGKEVTNKIINILIAHTRLAGTNHLIKEGYNTYQSCWAELNFHRIKLTDDTHHINFYRYQQWEKGILKKLKKYQTTNDNQLNYTLTEKRSEKSTEWLIQTKKNTLLPPELETFTKVHKININVDNYQPASSLIPTIYKKFKIVLKEIHTNKYKQNKHK